MRFFQHAIISQLCRLREPGIGSTACESQALLLELFLKQAIELLLQFIGAHF
jgi:hypothetical protein